MSDRIDEIDTFEAIAEYFNIDASRWTDDDKAAAGRYIMRQAALRIHYPAQAIEARRAVATKIDAVHESAVVADDAPKGDA